MLSLEAALDRVARAVVPVPPQVETVALASARDRILAQDVAMDHDVPPFTRATMDGVAVRAEDLAEGARLRMEGRTVAGDAQASPIPPGHARRTMTGAPVPGDAAMVVPFEWTREDGDEVILERLPGRGPHIVLQGAHVACGTVVLSAGTRLDAGGVGALAAAGRAEVPVACRPRVGILGTGTELVPPDTPPGPGRIRNSNGACLAAQVEAAGGLPVDLGIVGDDRGALRHAIRQGLKTDLLLLSGGVSRGDLDLVPGALEDEGVTCVFHRWAVQPGGPLWFGMHGATPVVGLPGNPAATYVGFEVLGVPLLRTRWGCALTPRRTVCARFEGTWGRAIGRRRFRPVDLHAEDGGLVARERPWRGSGDPFAFAGAEGLAVLPEDTPEQDRVEVIPVGPGARP